MSALILRDHSDEAYIEAINRSWNVLVSKFRNYPHYEYRDSPELSTMACSVKIPMFNRVTDTALSTGNVEEKVKETIQYFKEWGVPFTWQVNPWDKPANLAQVLEKVGLKASLTPGMVIKLSDLKEPEKPEEYRYKVVETAEGRDEFAWLMARAYGIPEEVHETFVDILNTIELTDDYQHYIGYLDDTPVSTASILYDCGVAGIYNVATMPEVRGKRMGSIITTTPLMDAKRKGYEISIHHSSPMGYNMYKRLGYREVCKMNRWEWSP
jgi:hypothetical protein